MAKIDFYPANRWRSAIYANKLIALEASVLQRIEYEANMLVTALSGAIRRAQSIGSAQGQVVLI